eukprot:9317202-Heterocapsa_arctica.AAC.1
MWFAPHVELMQGDPVEAIPAEGSLLIHYGYKIINLVALDEDGNDVFLTMRYEILNVKQVIMSCALSRKHGMKSIFGEDG